jgi:hypothetical protein
MRTKSKQLVKKITGRLLDKICPHEFVSFSNGTRDRAQSGLLFFGLGVKNVLAIGEHF